MSRRRWMNADVGEGVRMDDGSSVDVHVIPLIDLANIACGGHAGDEVQMRQAVRLSAANDVLIGAHPGFADREGFGRRMIAIRMGELHELVIHQVQTLQRIANEEGQQVKYVKPHGALYHWTANDPEAAKVMIQAIRCCDPQLAVVTLPNLSLAQEALRAGVTVWAEGFADRRYENDGQLSPRSLGETALIADPDQALEQAHALLRGTPFSARAGEKLSLKVDTICVHGDGPAALRMVKHLREGIETN